ncbi:MAG: hypothetical protein QG559_1558 [Campylobacterota bacterium]|nr:hypothetical protein [Campylobacterota bacterium]
MSDKFRITISIILLLLALLLSVGCSDKRVVTECRNNKVVSVIYKSKVFTNHMYTDTVYPIRNMKCEDLK